MTSIDETEVWSRAMNAKAVLYFDKVNNLWCVQYDTRSDIFFTALKDATGWLTRHGYKKAD